MDDEVHKVIALLPMRHNSERIQGKNYRPFGDGRPLFEHVLTALLDCQNITAVVINTDSDTVKKICSDKYPHVIIHVNVALRSLYTSVSCHLSQNPYTHTFCCKLCQICPPSTVTSWLRQLLPLYKASVSVVLLY